MLWVTPQIGLREEELTFTATLASGPGGQYVNRTASAVRLAFDVRRSPALPEGVRRRLVHLARGRITLDGLLLIEASAHRSQARNRAEAVERLCELIRQAAVPPRPRVPTRPTAGSRTRRLDAKRRQAGRKQDRRPTAD
ncbi:MAG: alternative ribosome rescue aminoacyl-tRNA hydrolase ArfB [Lentisphaeria bacterium]